VPIIGESSVEDVSEFIFQHITCKMPNQNISPLLYKRVNMHQRLKHNDYYRLSFATHVDSQIVNNESYLKTLIKINIAFN